MAGRSSAGAPSGLQGRLQPPWGPPTPGSRMRSAEARRAFYSRWPTTPSLSQPNLPSRPIAQPPGGLGSGGTGDNPVGHDGKGCVFPRRLRSRPSSKGNPPSLAPEPCRRVGPCYAMQEPVKFSFRDKVIGEVGVDRLVLSISREGLSGSSVRYGTESLLGKVVSSPRDPRARFPQ